jgi:hypothetical protein
MHAHRRSGEELPHSDLNTKDKINAEQSSGAFAASFRICSEQYEAWRILQMRSVF